MKLKFFISMLAILFGISSASLGYTEDSIEIDLKNNRIKVVNFSLGDSKINGDFSFTLDESDSSLIFNLEGKNISFGKSEIPWLKMQLVKRGKIIFINNFSLPQFKAKGNVNLEKKELSLEIEANFSGKFRTLSGDANLKMKLWGGVGNFLASGKLFARNGKYKNREFSEFRLDFFGKPPFFNITDSKFVLTNGSIVKMEGVLDLRDFSNLIPGVEIVVEKIFVDNWQLFSEDNKNIVMKKSIDGKLDVVLDTDRDLNEVARPRTEVRYNIKDNKFLKLRMQESNTILQFENKKEF